MKKILLFLAMSAIVLGMASCGGNEGNNPESKNYIVEVKSVTRHEIHVRITPNDKTKYFYCGIFDLKTFLDQTEKLVQTEIKTKVALAKVTNPNLKYPALLYQDFAERLFKDLSAGTDYAVYMCFVDEDYKIVGDIEYTVITTEAQTTLPDKFVKCEFTDKFFTSHGILDFEFMTNSEWYLDDDNIIGSGDGIWMEVDLFPGDRSNYLGTFTKGDNLDVFYSKMEGGKWLFKAVRPKAGGTIKVTKNDDGTYTFEFDLSFDQSPSYKGTITGITEQGFK